MQIDWARGADEIDRLLVRYARSLSAAAVAAVKHYVDYDELEMALEGLCLELIRLPEFSPEDRRACIALAKQFGLDQESVFDAGFWLKLTKRTADGED